MERPIKLKKERSILPKREITGRANKIQRDKN